jgi:hypothetical protein
MPSLADYYDDYSAPPSADTQQPEPVAQTPEEQAAAPTLSDHFHYLSNVYHNSLAGLHTAIGTLSDNPDETKYQDQLADQERSNAKDSYDNISAAGRDASQNWNKHYLHGALFGVEQMLPGVLAGTAGEIVGGPVLAAAGYGAVSATEFAGSASAAIKQMTPEQKAEKFGKDYTDLRQTMTDEDATNKIINDNITSGMAVAGVTGAIAGYSPFLGGPLTERAAKGFGFGAAQSAITNLALGVTTGDMPSTMEIAKQAGEAGLMFGGLSGVLGHEGAPQRGRERSEPVSDTTGAGVGSDRQGRKPEAQLKPPGSGKAPEGNTGTPPAPDLMTPDQRVALGATQETRQPTNKAAPAPEPQPTPTPEPQPAPAPVAAAPTPAPEPPRPPEPAPPPITPEVRSPEPTPVPAPKPPDPGIAAQQAASTAAIPERAETLRVQQAALANGKKEVVFYPQGEGFSQKDTKALRAQPNVETMRWPNKDVALFRTDGPNNLTADAVRGAVKQGRLNELLGLGPITREEATARVAGGETPAAVVEQTPQGTEARAAAGTAETAPTQAAAMEATKLAPENTVGVKPPGEVIRDRLAARKEPRVLPDISKPREAPAPVYKAEPEEVTPGVKHRTKEELKRIEDNNTAANRIMEIHEPAQREGVTDIYKRAARMVEEAKARGITIPKEVGDHHSAGMALLSEARELTSKQEPGPNAYARFLDREALLRAGKKDEALGIRKAEGAVELGGVETPDVAHEVTPESELIRKEEEAPKPRRTAEVVRLKSRAIKRQEMEGEPEKVIATDEDGNHVEVSPVHSSTAKEEIAKLYDAKYYAPSERAMNERLIKKLNSVAGDTPVHYISHEEMTDLGGPAYGLYDPDHDHILLNADYTQPDTMLHELFHAATTKALEKSPELKTLMERLRNEVATSDAVRYTPATLKGDIKYALSDPEEFLAGLMTNPNVQKLLKGVKLSDELAKDIGVPKWRKTTVWNGVLDIIRQALGMEPRDTAALEGAMAITERAIPSDTLTADTKLMPKYQRIAESPEYYSRGISKVTNDIRSKMKDRLEDLSPAGRTVMGKMRDLIDTPRDWLERAKENRWGLASAADNVIDHMGQLGADREKLVKLSTPVMDRLAKLYNVEPQEFNKLARLFVDSTIHGADARDDLGEGVNEHIKPNETNIENSNMEHWDAIKGNPKDRETYNSLKPDTQQLYNDTMDQLSSMNKEMVKTTRKSFVEKIKNEMDFSSLSKEYRDAIQKIIDRKDLTEEEEKKYGTDDTIKNLRNYDAMAARAERGAYFPLQRNDGTHFVGGEHDYNIPTNGKRLSNNEDSPDYHKIVFDSRKDAFKFDPDLPTSPNTVHYLEDSKGERQYTVTDPDTGKKRAVTADEAVTTPGVKYGQEHHVQVNPRDVRFVNGNVEGERVRKTMQAQGMKNVTSVQPRKNQELWQYGINLGHVSSIIRRLDKMDLTDTQRTGMADAIKHVAAASMPGSRLSRAFLQRDRTGGAGEDIIQSLDRYRRSSAGLQAMAGHRNEIDSSLEAMKKYVDQNAGHEDAGQMRQMVNMFDDRVNNFQRDSLSDISVNKKWNLVRSYTTLMDLVSPAFFFLHQLHIPLTVLPDLAAQHGLGTAARITLGVYRDMMGKELPMAFRATGKAFTSAWKYDHKPTDFIEALKNEANISGDEKKMIDYLVSRDMMHATGIDFSQAYTSASTLDKIASKSRNFSQEFIGSADAFNRFNSALMYYRAALEKGMKGEEAYKYVGDSIARTQGQYSSFQRMGLFKDPRIQAMLQYKQYPILMAKTIAKAMYNSIAPGVEWETRARALRTFGFMSLSAAGMSGVQGGTAYPIRMADDLLHGLGLTEGWETHMDELRRGLASQFGADGATLLMDGLGGMAGIYAGHRGGISDPLGINYLLETAKGDQDMYKWLAGPPGGLAHNLISGTGDLMQGDVVGGIKNLLPRMITDPIKGYQEYNEGVTTQKGKLISPPVSMPEAVMKALGFTTIEETHAREARSAVGRERQQQQTDRQRITEMWQGGDRAGALHELQRYNSQYPGARLTVQNISKMPKPTILGYPESKKNKAELEERARAYGLQ